MKECAVCPILTEHYRAVFPRIQMVSKLASQRTRRCAHFLLSDLTQISRSDVGRGSFKYRRAITKHFARASLVQCLRVSDSLFTQVREHAPKDGKSGGWLLIQLEEGSSWQPLQVFKRAGCRCRHVEPRGLTPLREKVEGEVIVDTGLRRPVRPFAQFPE